MSQTQPEARQHRLKNSCYKMHVWKQYKSIPGLQLESLPCSPGGPNSRELQTCLKGTRALRPLHAMAIFTLAHIISLSPFEKATKSSCSHLPLLTSAKWSSKHHSQVLAPGPGSPLWTAAALGKPGLEQQWIYTDKATCSLVCTWTNSVSTWQNFKVTIKQIEE